MVLVPRPGAPRVDQAMTRRRVLDLLGRLIEWRTERGSWTLRRERVFWRLLFGPHGMPEILEWTIEQGWEPPEVSLAEGISDGAILYSVKAGNIAPLLHFFPVSTWEPKHLKILYQGLLTWGGAKWHLLETLSAHGISLPSAVHDELRQHWIVQAGLGREPGILPELATAFPIKEWPSDRHATDFWAAFLTAPSEDFTAAIWWADHKLPVPPSLSRAVHRELLQGVLEGRANAPEALRRLFPHKQYAATYPDDLRRVVRDLPSLASINLGRGLLRLRQEAGYPVQHNLLFEIARELYVKADYWVGREEQINNIFRAGLKIPLKCPPSHPDASSADMESFLGFLTSLVEEIDIKYRPGPAPKFSRKTLAAHLADEPPPDGMTKREWKFTCARYSYYRFNEGWLRKIAKIAPASILRAALGVAQKQGCLPTNNTFSDHCLRQRIWRCCIIQNRGSVLYRRSAGKLQVLIDEKFPLSLLFADKTDGFPSRENPVSLFIRSATARFFARRLVYGRPINLQLLAAYLNHAAEWISQQSEMPTLRDVGRCFWRLEPLGKQDETTRPISELLKSFLGEKWFRLWQVVYCWQEVKNVAEGQVLWNFVVRKRAAAAILKLKHEFPAPDGNAQQALIRAELLMHLKPATDPCQLLDKKWVSTWSDETLWWFWANPQFAANGFGVAEDIPLPPESESAVRNQRVLAKLLAKGEIKHLENFIRRIPPGSWTEPMWQATRSFISFAAKPWTVHTFLTGLKDYRADANWIERIVRRLPRLHRDSWRSGEEVHTFLDQNPDILADPHLIRTFWRAVFPRKDKASAVLEVLVKAVEVFPLPYRWLGALTRWKHRHRWNYRVMSWEFNDLFLFGSASNRDLRDFLKAARVWEPSDILEFILTKIVPLCKPVRDDLVETLKALVVGFRSNEFGEDIEMCLFFYSFYYSADTLQGIYNSLPEFGLRQPSIDELTRVGDSRKHANHFHHDTCSFRIFIERLRQAGTLKQIDQQPREVVVELDGGLA